MTVTPSDLAEFVADAQAAIHEEEQRLNAADAKLGDGDTGSMLCRVIDAMVGTDTVARPAWRTPLWASLKRR